MTVEISQVAIWASIASPIIAESMKSPMNSVDVANYPHSLYLLPRY